LRGLSGRATLAAPASLDHGEPYRVKTTWTADKPIYIADRDWRPPSDVAYIAGSPTALLPSLEPIKRVHPAPCRPGHLIHDYIIEPPVGLSLKDLPQTVEVVRPAFTFRRTWRLDGRTLTMRTEIASSFQTRSCTPEVMNAIIDALEAAKEKANPALRFSRMEIAEARGPLQRLVSWLQDMFSR
jgi:hypothetical protein